MFQRRREKGMHGVHKGWSSGAGSCELQDVLQVLVLQISVGGRSFDCK